MQGEPRGLSVVTVIVTILPASPATGVYVRANGDVEIAPGVTVPAPSVVIVTKVALVNVFPLKVKGAVTQVLPLTLLRLTAGPFTQAQDTLKLLPVVVQPEPLRTVMA